MITRLSGAWNLKYFHLSPWEYFHLEGNFDIFSPCNYQFWKVMRHSTPKQPCAFQNFSQSFLTRKEQAFQKTKGVPRAEEDHQSDWQGWKRRVCQGLGSTMHLGALLQHLVWTCRRCWKNTGPFSRGLWTAWSSASDSLISKSTPSPTPCHPPLHHLSQSLWICFIRCLLKCVPISAGVCMCMHVCVSSARNTE